MKTPPPEHPFDPDDPNFDPWADDPNAPKEPGIGEDEPSEPLPWDADSDSDSDENPDEPHSDDESDESHDGADEPSTPRPGELTRPRGPAALLDSELRGEIEFEILFQRTRSEFHQPPTEPVKSRIAVFLFWPMALILTSVGAIYHGLTGAAAAIVTLALHEFGHYAAQLLFGYRERGLRFTPVLARLLANKPTTASPVARTITFLAGPLPGLLLAFAIQIFVQPDLESTWQFFVLMLVGYNLAEHWVSGVSDGGKVFELVPFLRRPWVNVVARALVIGLLIAIAVWMPLWWFRIMLGFVIAAAILGTLNAHRLARSRQALSNIFPEMPDRTNAIPEPMVRQLFSVALALETQNYEPVHLARIMHNLHEQSQVPAMRRPTTFGLFAVYLLGWALAIGTITLFYEAAVDRQTAVEQLLGHVESALTGDPQNRKAQLEDCIAKWAAAEPGVRQQALHYLERWHEKPPPKPAAVANLIERLKTIP